jgi:excisionase family DNA binding protein
MRKKPTTQHLTVGPREVARITGLGVAAVYGLLRSGEMPSIKVGKKYFVPRSALLKWLENCGGNTLTA